MKPHPHQGDVRLAEAHSQAMGSQRRIVLSIGVIQVPDHLVIGKLLLGLHVIAPVILDKKLFRPAGHISIGSVQGQPFPLIIRRRTIQQQGEADLAVQAFLCAISELQVVKPFLLHLELPGDLAPFAQHRQFFAVLG